MGTQKLWAPTGSARTHAQKPPGETFTTLYFYIFVTCILLNSMYFQMIFKTSNALKSISSHWAETKKNPSVQLNSISMVENGFIFVCYAC